MRNDLVVIFQSYLVLWGYQLLAWPWLSKYCHKLADKGWSLGRVGGSLLTAFVIWWLSFLRLPMNTDWGLTLVLLIFVFFTWWRFKGDLKHTFLSIKTNWKIIFFEEIIFAISYFGFSLVRGFAPDILGLEKYMDFGFINSYLHSPTLPAPDMWFAGKSINYYSFGHFWASNVIRTWGINPAIGYNLMLAFLFASCFVISLSILVSLGSPWIAGIFGSLMIVLGGNSHTIWSLLSKHTLSGYWYADATRFIHNTIHEFPAYSFVVSDLHAHILGLPAVLFFILLTVLWWTDGGRLWIYVTLGWLLGIMAMTNSWDSPNYGLFLVIFCGLRLLSNRKLLPEFLKAGVIIGVSAIVTALPWGVSFKSILGGIGNVTERSPLWQLLVLWTIHLIFTFAAIMLVRKQKKINFLILAMGITAVTLIVIPEFIYMRDIYLTHPRANTMFKLTFQSFVLMSLLAGFVFGKVVEVEKKIYRFMGVLLCTVLFIGLMLFPVEAYGTYYNRFLNYRGLDGASHLLNTNPTDLSIINLLNKYRNGKNIIESPGDSFTEFNTISAYTGIPTVVGWRAHEWLWRGSYDEVGRRDEEVRRFYESSNGNEMLSIIKNYNIGWIIITNREREKYKSMNEVKILRLGKVVFSEGNSYIVEIN